MFCKVVWILVIFYNYIDIAKSLTSEKDVSSVIQEKYHTIENERLRKIVSDFTNGKIRTRERTKRSVVMIVNDDFDIPVNISKFENSSEIDVKNEYEGSGNDEFEETEPSVTPTRSTKLGFLSTKKVTSDLTTQPASAIKSKPTTSSESKITSLTDAESSGDGILMFTTESTTGETEITVKEIILPDICLNTTCNENDLVVSASDDHTFVAEGTNLTLFCKSDNSSNHMLYWYKSNGSDYFLQIFSTEEENHFNIPDIKPIHSGSYICVKWVDRQTCCNTQKDLIVYEVPLYSYHLIIIGLIAALCLILCIFLSIRRLRSLKTYTKQFVEKHGNTKTQQLLY